MVISKKTKKIAILGNGFDLRHFLPTSYNHFITVLQEIEKLDFSKIVSFEDVFGGVFKNQNQDFYNGIIEYYETKNIVFDSGKIDILKKRIKENSWYQYFKTVESYKIKTWIDFESEIKFTIETLIILLNDIEDRTRNERSIIQWKDDVFHLNTKSYSDLHFNLRYKNILSLFKIIDDLYYQIDNKYLFGHNGIFQHFLKDSIYQDIYNSLEDFIGIFNDYLVLIISPFYEWFKENKKDGFIREASHLKKSFFENFSNIFTFNYTPTFNFFYSSKIQDNFKTTHFVEHIHGSIKNDWKNINEIDLVLGIDEIDDEMKELKMFSFTKYFQKLHKNTNYLFLNSKQLLNIHENITFYFWGHSLDISDQAYIREVFDNLKNYKNVMKVFYHSVSAKADQLKNLLNIMGKLEIEKLMKEERLIFIESTPKNLSAELN